MVHFSAHVTDTFGLCNDFANRDQKSLFAAFQSHSSMSSIKSPSVNELQCHSVNVRANCASTIFFTTSSCRMHWSTCCSKACVSTPDGREHLWPPSAVGKVCGEFAVDHATVHVKRFYTLVPRFSADPPTPSHSVTM